MVAAIHSCKGTYWALSVCNLCAKCRRHSECNRHGFHGLRKGQMVNIHK